MHQVSSMLAKRCNFSRTEIALKLQVVYTRDLKLQSATAPKIVTKIASKIASVNGPLCFSLLYLLSLEKQETARKLKSLQSPESKT